MNSRLWLRIKEIFNNRDDLDLSNEQHRIVYLYQQMFIRAGAELSQSKKRRYATIMSELAILGTKFSQNLLADENSWQMELTIKDLDGLPNFLKDALAIASQAKSNHGYILTLNRALVVPFLQFSPNRQLRQKAYQAWASRGNNNNSNNNLEVITKILRLREERAKLLGYKSFSDFKLENQMAKSPENVESLLMSVWKPAVLKAKKDNHQLQNLLVEDGINDSLQPWDWRYYAEKRRANEYDINEVEIKSHFQLHKLIEAIFYCAKRLFNLDFEEISLNLHHEKAKCWKVTKNGEYLALFVGDYFTRDTKRSGAWCSSFKNQSKFNGNKRPIVINVCNFDLPKEGNPCLLSFDEASTLFHEFGHALHVILSDVTYPSVSGTSVARDFVELPSQLFEHWLEVPEILEKFAINYETQKPISKKLIKKLLDSKNIDQGFSTVEYLASAIVDLNFHNASSPKDPLKLQKEILKGIDMPLAIEMRHSATQFAHIFAGDGYSSGYYSYMWSEVMDADAFKAFEETNNPFDRNVAESLLNCILSKGGSVAPEEAYKNFRGKLPDVNALLQQRNLVEIN
jgi:peptidyl-dipeptidase Dcp